MTRTLLVAGTASHVGKSTVAAGLCRLLADRGVSVAPFKAQNMSNNARAVLSPEHEGGDSGGDNSGDKSPEWGEIGVSQYVQAQAAEVTPTTDSNPVLLKPRGDGESQLIVQGEAVGHFEAGSYYDDHWETAHRAAIESYERLASDNEIIVAEGAGSIAEINLHDRDLANVETARFADAGILLVVDIERGGAFASLYGTLELMPDDLREQVVGAVVTKFRGDESLLDPGIEEFEDRTGVPILGVLPYDDPGLPEEDSVSLPAPGERAVWGDDDGVPDERAVTVAVPRLPHVSNFTDLEPLAREPGVRVAYVPLDADLAGVEGDGDLAEVGGDGVEKADAVVLPGTKNTVDDLLALREAGFADALADFDGPIVGLCGGYQMLGEQITNATVESTTESCEQVAGLDLLPVTTRFSPKKRVEEVTRSVEGTGPIAGAKGQISGYEIHMGDSEPTEAVPQPLSEGSAATEEVLGTYLHGLFENEVVRSAFVAQVFDSVGKTPPERDGGDRSPYDSAAKLIRENVDLEALGLPEV